MQLDNSGDELNIPLEQGSPTFWKLRATSYVPINAKGYWFDIHFWNKSFAQFAFNYFSIDVC